MKKIKIQIKNRWNKSVLFEYEKEDNTIKKTLEKAVEKGANLEGAYLYITDYNLEEIPDGNKAIKTFEKQTNINILQTYINKHILSPYYLAPWKNRTNY